MALLPTAQPWLVVYMVIALSAPACRAGSSSDNSSTGDELALLSFASVISDPTGALSSWNTSGAGDGYCRWRGVTCGVRGGAQRVIALNLTSLDLNGPLTPSIANLTFLQTLDLSGNLLQGSMTPEVGRLLDLQYLNLSYNSVHSEIPANLSQCKNLQYLDISNNWLSGSIPVSLGSLHSLVFLHLSANNLTGSIPPSLGNLTSLTDLALDQNNLQGPIPSSFGRLARLKKVWLYQNELSGAIPSSFFNISSIVEIVVGNNKLSGSLPPDMGFTLPNLQIFAAFNNDFEGYLPNSLANASELWYLVILNNNFRGTVPPKLGSSGKLIQVIIGQNQFEARDEQQWQFLTSLTNSTGLQGLNMGYNKFEGALPSSFANLSTELFRLGLSHNQLSGSIPPEIGKFVKLNKFALDQNMFQGVIPSTIGNLKQLKELYMHRNELQGEIPPSIGNLTQLTKLDLSRNKLQGSIPASFGSLISIAALNLSYNELNGTIPRGVVSLSSLSQYLDLSHNSLSGALPSEVGSLQNLAMLNVSQNELSGEIPGTLGACVIMQQLYMQGNRFEGAIPPQLSGLKGIQELDLSRNNLSGSIPDFLESLNLLHYLNLSYNNLEGQVPDTGVFSNPSAVSLAGNADLCGDDSELHLPPCPAKSSKHKSPKLKLILAASLPPSVIFMALLFWGIRHSIRTQRRSASPRGHFHSESFHQTPYGHPFFRRRRTSYDQIRAATNGFSQSNLIGAGSFGKVYKGFLGSDTSKVFAIKVLNLEQRGAHESFIAECDALRHLHHRNLVRIITACSSVDHKGDEFKALVFEFMPNGSLDDWLHPRTKEEGGEGRGRRLILDQRLSIAIDVASALDYLHQHSHVPIVHSDLKPSNVLLNDDMGACVADFGLASLLKGATSKSRTQEHTSSIAVKGSIGYIAPEYGMGSRPSTACDVYSYGVLLLEMFTGKRPVDDAFSGDRDLHSYVEAAFPEQVMEVIDQTLLLPEKEEEEEEEEEEAAAAEASIYNGSEGMRSFRGRIQSLVVSVFQIGLLCSKHSPKDRMEMGDVVKELHKIRKAFHEGEFEFPNYSN